MGTYKILLEDSIGYDFTLIAIHGSLEPYYLAFLLNKNLEIHLSRSREDLYIGSFEKTASFPFFDFEDNSQYIDYYVLSNKSKIEAQKVETSGLFVSDQTVKTVHFIPEMPQVDFFLKIVEDGTAFAKAKTLKILNQIPQIVTAYEVNVSTLKSKENLIFD